MGLVAALRARMLSRRADFLEGLSMMASGSAGAVTGDLGARVFGGGSDFRASSTFRLAFDFGLGLAIGSHGGDKGWVGNAIPPEVNPRLDLVMTKYGRKGGQIYSPNWILRGGRSKNGGTESFGAPGADFPVRGGFQRWHPAPAPWAAQVSEFLAVLDIDCDKLCPD